MSERSAFLIMNEGVVTKSVKVVKAKSAKSLIGARTRTREKGIFGFIYRPLLAVVGGC